MSRYNHADERDIWRAMVVDAYTEYSWLEYLAHHSRADTTEIQP